MALFVGAPPQHTCGAMDLVRPQVDAHKICRRFVGADHRPQCAKLFYQARAVTDIAVKLCLTGRVKRRAHRGNGIVPGIRHEVRIGVGSENVARLSLSGDRPTTLILCWCQPVHARDHRSRRVGGANRVCNRHAPSGRFFLRSNGRQIITFVTEVPRVDGVTLAKM